VALPKQPGPQLLVIDEFTQVRDPDVRIFAIELIDEGRIDHFNYELPPLTVVVLIGNRRSDLSAAVIVPANVQNRITEITVLTELGRWKEDWAWKNGTDVELIVFLSAYPDLLAAAQVPRDGSPFHSARAYQVLTFRRRVPRVRQSPRMLEAVTIGTVGEAAAREFLYFQKQTEPAATQAGEVLAGVRATFELPQKDAQWWRALGVILLAFSGVPVAARTAARVLLEQAPAALRAEIRRDLEMYLAARPTLQRKRIRRPGRRARTVDARTEYAPARTQVGTAAAGESPLHYACNTGAASLQSRRGTGITAQKRGRTAHE
jgi:hypothetical protein